MSEFIVVSGATQRKEIVALVKSSWYDWKDDTCRKDAEQAWKDANDSYLGKTLPAFEAYLRRNRCRAHIPLAQEIADSIHGALVGMLLPIGHRFFRIRYIGPTKPPIDYGPTLETCFEAYLTAMRFRPKFSDYLRLLVNKGNSVLTKSWLRTTRKVAPKPSPFATSKRKASLEEIVIYDGPSIEIAAPEDVVFDPNLKELTSENLSIRRSSITLGELQQLDNVYENIDEVRKRVQAKPTPGVEELKEVDLTTPICLLTAVGNFITPSGVYKGFVATLASPADPAYADPEAEPILLRFHRDDIGLAPYWGTFIKFPDRYWGKGVLEPIVDLQQVYNVFIRQGIDVVNKHLNGVYKFVDDYTFDEEKFSDAIEGGLVRVGDINNLSSLAPPPGVAASLSEISMLRTEAQLSAGVSEFLLGSTTRIQGRRTAREASFISQGTQGRIGSILSNLVEVTLNPLLNDLFTVLLFLKQESGELPDGVFESGHYEVVFTGAETTLRKLEEVGNIERFIGLLKGQPMPPRLYDMLVRKIAILLDVPEGSEYETESITSIPVESPMPGASPLMSGAPLGESAGGAPGSSGELPN